MCFAAEVAFDLFAASLEGDVALRFVSLAGLFLTTKVLVLAAADAMTARLVTAVALCFEFFRAFSLATTSTAAFFLAFSFAARAAPAYLLP